VKVLRVLFIAGCIILSASAQSIGSSSSLNYLWGPVEQGVRVALSLNKLTYAVGEDIPLHVAAQVLLSSKVPVYAEPERFSPAFDAGFAAAFHLTIIGDDGIIVGNENSSNLELPQGIITTGFSVCPAAAEPGAVYTLERSAKALDLLPSQPGKYRLSVTWSPYPFTTCGSGVVYEVPRPDELHPLVTVHSATVTIRIVGKAMAQGGIPDVPVYNGWEKDFCAVDTSLGVATALEDLRSHVQWLRLSLTRGWPLDSLRKQMVDGGRFEGWRFATGSELDTLLANFTGAADGRSTDPGIERALQHVLGGPLSTPSNPKTGWSRRATNAVLAEMRPASPGESPGTPASVPGSRPPCKGCGVGFIITFAYIGEDTLNGHVNATVERQVGWRIDKEVASDLAEGILLVRSGQ